MRVLVSGPTTRLLWVEVEGSDTVQSLKDAIVQHIPVLERGMRLLFMGRALDDNSSLESSKLKDGSQLLVVGGPDVPSGWESDVASEVHSGNSPAANDHHPVLPQLEASAFSCPVCLNFLHKPAMNWCGHVFCYTCMLQAMDPLSPSQCPLCRSEYAHFPAVCVPLHEVATALFPKHAAARLEDHRKEQEEEQGFPSPRIPVGKAPEPSTVASLQAFVASRLACHKCNKLAVECAAPPCGHIVCGECLEGGMSVCEKEGCGLQVPTSLVPSVVVFAVLKQCGLVPADRQPRLSPITQPDAEEQRANEGQEGKGKGGKGKDGKPQLGGNLGFVNVGIGCDVCGEFPIVGRRYQCQVCIKEHPDVGFDVCGKCYDAKAHQHPNVGRFAQAHKPEHEMKHVRVKEFIHTLKEANPELSLAEIMQLLAHAQIEYGQPQE